MPKSLLWFSILALIWSIYYLAMHITGGILTRVDAVVCGAVTTFCLIVIVAHFCKARTPRQ